MFGITAIGRSELPSCTHTTSVQGRSIQIRRELVELLSSSVRASTWLWPCKTQTQWLSSLIESRHDRITLWNSDRGALTTDCIIRTAAAAWEETSVAACRHGCIGEVVVQILSKCHQQGLQQKRFLLEQRSKSGYKASLSLHIDFTSTWFRH